MIDSIVPLREVLMEELCSEQHFLILPSLLTSKQVSLTSLTQILDLTSRMLFHKAILAS